MDSCFRRFFIDHPASVGENYFSHAFKAVYFGVNLIGFGIFELIHAAVPGIDVFELMGTRSDIQLETLCRELRGRRGEL